MRIAKLFGVVGAVAAMSWAAPAFATSYGSATSPLRITSNGNGWFYGNVTVDQQTALRNGYSYRDTGADGNPVYVQTNWYYWLSCENGSGCYDTSGSDQSPRIGTDAGKVHSEDFDTLDSRADKGRAITKVCEDQAWSPDPCSSKVIVTLSY